MTSLVYSGLIFSFSPDLRVDEDPTMMYSQKITISLFKTGNVLIMVGGSAGKPAEYIHDPALLTSAVSFVMAVISEDASGGDEAVMIPPASPWHPPPVAQRNALSGKMRMIAKRAQLLDDEPEGMEMDQDVRA